MSGVPVINGGKGEIGETSTLQRVHAAFVLTDGMINDPER